MTFYLRADLSIFICSGKVKPRRWLCIELDIRTIAPRWPKNISFGDFTPCCSFFYILSDAFVIPSEGWIEFLHPLNILRRYSFLKVIVITGGKINIHLIAVIIDV